MCQEKLEGFHKNLLLILILTVEKRFCSLILLIITVSVYWISRNPFLLLDTALMDILFCGLRCPNERFRDSRMKINELLRHERVSANGLYGRNLYLPVMKYADDAKMHLQ